MNLVRKYKLFKLLNFPLSQKEKEIITFVDNWFNNLTNVEFKEHMYSIFYVKDKKVLFERYDRKECLIFLYHGFWKELEDFGMCDKDIISLLTYFIKIKLGLKNYTLISDKTHVDSFSNIENKL